MAILNSELAGYVSACRFFSVGKLHYVCEIATDFRSIFSTKLFRDI